MSSDDGYVLYQREDLKWTYFYVNMSMDWTFQDSLDHPRNAWYNTLEDCSLAVSGLASNTEYGVTRIIHWQNQVEVVIPQESGPSSLGYENQSIENVYIALHENGIHGELAIKIVETINAKGVMFVPKPEIPIYKRSDGIQV